MHSRDGNSPDRGSWSRSAELKVALENRFVIARPGDPVSGGRQQSFSGGLLGLRFREVLEPLVIALAQEHLLGILSRDIRAVEGQKDEDWRFLTTWVPGPRLPSHDNGNQNQRGSQRRPHKPA